MTSEPDSAPHRRTPTIDLKATEIETEPHMEKPAGTRSADAAAEQAPSGQSASGEASITNSANSPGRLNRRVTWHLVSAAAGAIVAAATLVGLHIAGLNPLQTVTRPVLPSAPNQVTTDATPKISSQLDKMEAQLQSQPTESTLAARLTKVEAQTKALNESLAAVNQRIDAIAVAAQSAREHADEASAAAKGVAQTKIGPSDLDALAKRIAALEGSIKSLSETTAQRAASADDRAARGAVAAEALRAAVERGAPFTAELTTVKSFGADQGAVTALEPFAAYGLPTAGDLARELSQLTKSLKQASGTKPADASFLGRLEDNARNLVRITPINAPPGDQPAAVIGRLDADATHADIAAALTDIAHLPAAAKTITEPWQQKVNARNAAIAASRRIAADALAALANAKTQ